MLTNKLWNRMTPHYQKMSLMKNPKEQSLQAPPLLDRSNHSFMYHHTERPRHLMLMSQLEQSFSVAQLHQAFLDPWGPTLPSKIALPVAIIAFHYRHIKVQRCSKAMSKDTAESLVLLLLVDFSLGHFLFLITVEICQRRFLHYFDLGISVSAKYVPFVELQVVAKDADYQKALVESMKTAYALPWCPLPPVVIRELESGKYQSLSEVPGKGKAKVTEKQVSHDLLSHQKAKKKSPAEQYIFQRRTFTTTGSLGQNEPSYAEIERSKSKTIEKVVPRADKVGQGESEGQARPDPGAQAKGQMGSDTGAQDETYEGQAGSNPDETSKGQARLYPGNAVGEIQSIPSHVVYIGSDREHMDLDAANVPPQPSQEQLDERFTTTVNPKFKATTTETTTTTLPPPTAQQQSTTEPMMMKHIGELEHIMANLIKVNKEVEERLDTHGACLYRLEQLDIPQQVSKAVSEVVIDAVDWAMQAPLRNHFKDLSKADMKEILHQRMWETESYKSHKDHMQLFEALEKSMNRDHSEELTQDLAEARKKKKKSRESPKTPHGSPPHQPPPPPPPARSFEASGALGASGSSQMPPPPPPPSSTTQESLSKGSAAPSSLKTATLAEYQAWMMTDIKLRPSISLTPADLEIDEGMAPDEQVQLADDEDIMSAHILKVNLRQDWASALTSSYLPPPEDSLLAQTGDIATFIDWFCKRRGITELKPQYLEGPAFEIAKVFHPDVIHLQYQIEECHKLLTDSVDDPILRHNVSKPLPLGGPPGQVSIQSDFFFNKDLEYPRYGSKGSRPALSISKLKVAYYPDTGLEQMVPDQFWIEEECKYDIAAMYVKTHMQILSVIRIKDFSLYGYDYIKKIVLRRADLNEHVIVERGFKYMYPSDFEDLYLLNLQGHVNNLPPKDNKILTMVVNQWTRHL
nr:hypothetical protein [Tanacetum cinerariifolium]